MFPHTPFQWLEVVSLGILLGAVGQGARAIVGIKKAIANAGDSNAMSPPFDSARLLISFGIGGVAGAFAAITMITDLAAINLQTLFTIAASGYAGADFIEGFMGRISGSQPSPAPALANPANKNLFDDAVG
jgi:hypothetical protein